jgi:predicted naringenin-chalcone synthase
MSYLNRIETAVPGYCYTQEYIEKRMLDWTEHARMKRYIKRVYRGTGITKRYSVVPDFGAMESSEFLGYTDDGTPINPSTETRNDIFERESKKLAVEAAGKAMSSSGLRPEEVTHVITVSCTGFYNPGPDFHLVQALGLSDRTQRYNLGFMGCYGAFPALRMADQFCKADPQAVVLVVCIELCTLHVQFNSNTDSLLANALFSDGVAAAVVSSRPSLNGQPSLRMDEFSSALLTNGENEMAWTIGNTGFEITLSQYVPRIIGENIAALTNRTFEGLDVAVQDIDCWAIHPGGRSIVDNIEEQLGLSAEQVKYSRQVLSEYGNMSSATVLFVMQKILAELTEESSTICGMAFGPGLTVEMAIMQPVLASVGSPAARTVFSRKPA